MTDQSPEPQDSQQAKEAEKEQPEQEAAQRDRVLLRGRGMGCIRCVDRSVLVSIEGQLWT